MPNFALPSQNTYNKKISKRYYKAHFLEINKEHTLCSGLLGITSYSRQDPEMALAFMFCSTTTKMLYQILGNK